MSAIADDALPRHRLRVEDFHRVAEAGVFHEDERVELIEGDIIDMAPIGSAHAGAVKRLGNLIKLAVGPTAIVSVQDPVVLGSYSEPRPDVAVLRPRDDFYSASHPGAEAVLLIVEVAEQSLRYDREIKIPLYARHGVPEVWLVDLVNKQLVIHRLPSPEGYRSINAAMALTRVTVEAIPGVELDLQNLFYT